MEKTKLDQVITFEHDSDEITPAARTTLEEIARYLSQPEQENVNRLELEVSLENVGSDVYNDNLSIKRSLAAQKILKQKLELFRRKEIYYITSISATEGNDTNLSQILFFIEQLAQQVDEKFTHICSLMLRHGWTSENLPQAYPEDLRTLLQEGLSVLQPFEITDENWDNLTLIQALVEFYMNYTNPWGTGETVGETVPRLPGMQDYITVDLSNDWHLVLIDPCDGRLRGSEFFSDSNSNDIVIEGINVDKINPGFDTIYLEAAKSKKIFRIESVTSPNIITLDDIPNFNIGVGTGPISSNWHIPAGFSRQLEEMDLNYNLGPGGNQGWDHYDGMMLIIKDGAVHAKYPWSSYTSRAATGNNRSSLEGNNSYTFKSLRAATNPSINYAFWIPTEAPSNQIPTTYFYFDPGNGDSVQRNGIMIHYGTRNSPTGGSGSSGCPVSPEFYDFRDKMIELYQEDYQENNGQIDAKVNNLYGLNHQQSINLYNNNGVAADQWYNKINGTLWLVRPEQPPISG